MSNFLAIAAATETLRALLDAAVSTDVDGASATAVHPSAKPALLPAVGVNVYLYHVAPNAAWRNADAPTRSANGGVVQRPRAAVDLHYLFSFHGDETRFEPQRVLGSVLRTVHEEPLLARRRIRSAVQNIDLLKATDLDQDVELVKLTQIPLSLEDLSKLWSVFFQATYVLSVAFQASVVLIEGQSTPRPTLPVRQRSLTVVTYRQPLIEAATSAADPPLPITAGSVLRIAGAGLRGDQTRVRIGAELITPPPDQVGDRRIDVTLPPSLRAGVHMVQVEQLRLLGAPPTLHSGVESNAAPFVLQPSITAVAAGITPTLVDGNPLVVEGVALLTATVTVNFTPRVARAQRVRLLLYELGAPEGRPPYAYSFAAPPNNGVAGAAADTPSIAFVVQRIQPAEYLVRVQVDGAESSLASAAAGQYDAPKVAIV